MDEQPCSGCGAWDEDVLCPECRRTKAPTHAAAVSGCTGTGEEYATPEHTDEWGWCSWYNCWVQLSPEGRTLQAVDELPGCTASTAVLKGVGR